MEVDMSRALNRTERLRKIEQLYLYGAFTDEEMAERVGVDSRTTIYKDRQLLMTEGIPFEEVERGRWRIDRKKYLSNLRVNVHQAAQLYLMARRLARQTRRPNPHVVSVLKSLALILHQPLMDRLHQSADFIPQATDESEKTAVLEKLVACWVEQRKVRFRYQGLDARQPTVHLVSPYLLEPSLLGEAIYLVGHSETMNKIVPFKIDRIEKAADTSQPIIPPESFDETEFIRSVWSIWGSEGEPVTVKLRFRGETAVRRVQETIWHPNQAEPELLPNGDLLWTAQVAEWREMLPWIRGWGAQVEVLEPPELRMELLREIKRMMQVYSLYDSENVSRNDPEYHQKRAKSLFRE
jgi:predicted DNA-binding transcriptional regulator YafY